MSDTEDFADTTPRRRLSAVAIFLVMFGALVIIVGLWGFLILVASWAKAEDVDGRWVMRTVKQQHWRCDWDGSCYRAYRYVRVRQYQPRVYGYERREPSYRERDNSGGCRDIRRAVGDQHLTVDGAKKAANDAWAALVRFHMGEKFIDLNNARHMTYTCSRSSIKEGGVTTLGQTLNRCELEAVPCSPPRDKEDRDR